MSKNVRIAPAWPYLLRLAKELGFFVVVVSFFFFFLNCGSEGKHVHLFDTMITSAIVLEAVKL